MRVARRTFVLLALQLVLIDCAGLGPSRQALQPHLAPIRVSASSVARGGPVLFGPSDCGLGAAASDATAAHAPASALGGSFEPRWRPDVSRVVRVQIEDAPTLPGWTNAHRAEVIAALSAWQLAGAPVHFVVVARDEPADVTVHWIDRFDSRYEGWTTVTWNHAGWLINGDVQLALHNPSGQLLSVSEREQVAMHELGHVLGLSHSGSPVSIMSPVVRVAAIAPIDVAALRALYQGTGGSEAAGDPQRGVASSSGSPIGARAGAARNDMNRAGAAAGRCESPEI